MCLLAFAWDVHPRYKLIFAGNRDERHARASAAAHCWDDAPQVLAGRDLEAGGTWLGLTLTGRFAVVTNYREGLDPPKARLSRGALTADFLKGGMSAADYIKGLHPHAGDYGGFSLIIGDSQALHYYSNRGGPEGPIAPGIHGLSNHLLDTPWPKVELSKSRLAALLEQDSGTSDVLFKLLADRGEAAQDKLPDTGIGLELERRVSAPFVVNSVYGTRCSTAIRLSRGGGFHFAERRFDPTGESLGTRHFQLADAA